MSSKAASKHPIGLWTLVALVVANMIGSGLYVGSHYALATLGDARWVLLVWGMGACMALCGAIAYGAMCQRLPISGGEYLYLSRLIHPSVGFLAGWISLVAGFTSPIASAALIVGEFGLGAGSNSNLHVNLVASAVILAGVLVHAIHLKTGAWLQNGIVLLKVFCLLWFLILAVGFGPENGWLSGRLSPHPLEEATTWSWLAALLGALAWISFSYTGFNAGVYLSGELENGSQIVPRSMWIATLVVSGLYLSLNAVFLYGLPPQQIVSDQRFVLQVAFSVGSNTLEALMRTAIVLSSATSVLAMLMAGPRVYAQMSRDGVMPKWFDSRRGIPRLAIVIQGLLSILVVWTADLKSLIGYMGLTLSACGALAISGIWWMKYRIPNAKPLRWYEHFAAVIFVVITIVILVVAYFDPLLKSQVIACGITFGIGIIVYAIASSIEYRRRSSR